MMYWIKFNRVLGGGLVPGSVTLLGGEPGIGKSTLLLQVCLNLPFKTLYVSGEESAQQIKMRADRIKKETPNCYILTETKTQNIFRQLADVLPDVLIIDSIQTLQTNVIESTAGSVSQIRECTGELIKFAKETNTPVLLIGHITKDGNIAGPKILEHMVDTVLQFEGDRNHTYRILRALKNRFGSTHEIGIYEMLGHGLREVKNPSELLISQRGNSLSGTAIAATMEGMRPLMIEVQALVSTAVYGTPQRSATGYNLKRLNMILAVLEKRAGFKLGQKDVFLNITGGITVDDPAIDLAVVAAILSSNFDIELSSQHCYSAEVGLGGEIRPVIHLEDIEGNSFIYEDIIEQHKGKVIYVDFWASWCGPCRKEMPASQELKERYKDKDVVFLYVSVDQNNSMWEGANSSFQLDENSFIALNYPKAKHFQLREVSNIPRYMLYDKNGRMLDDNALRPSNQALTTVIDGLLKI